MITRVFLGVRRHDQGVYREGYWGVGTGRALVQCCLFDGIRHSQAGLLGVLALLRRRD
jgi:hypothetical protein